MGPLGPSAPSCAPGWESPSGRFRLRAGLSLASLRLAVWHSDSRVPLLLAKLGLRLSEPRAGDISPREASGGWSRRRWGPGEQAAPSFPWGGQRR